MTLFPPPRNRLERTIMDHSLWSVGMFYYPTHYLKHTAKEMYMHQFTIPPLDAESPLFSKYVVDEDEDTDI